MTRDEVLELCESLPGAVEDYPFGDDFAVFKVGDRMIALVMLNESPGRMNLKCDPDLALELRARHPAVSPGCHATIATGTPWSLTALSRTTTFER